MEKYISYTAKTAINTLNLLFIYYLVINYCYGDTPLWRYVLLKMGKIQVGKFYHIYGQSHFYALGVVQYRRHDNDPIFYELADKWLFIVRNFTLLGILACECLLIPVRDIAEWESILLPKGKNPNGWKVHFNGFEEPFGIKSIKEGGKIES